MHWWHHGRHWEPHFGPLDKRKHLLFQCTLNGIYLLVNCNWLCPHADFVNNHLGCCHGCVINRIRPSFEFVTWRDERRRNSSILLYLSESVMCWDELWYETQWDEFHLHRCIHPNLWWVLMSYNEVETKLTAISAIVFVQWILKSKISVFSMLIGESVLFDDPLTNRASRATRNMTTFPFV